MKYLLAIALSTLCTFTFANDNTRKIDIVKNIYKLTINNGKDSDTVLKANATPEFKKVLNTSEAIHISKFDGEYCDWVRDVLISGQDSNTKFNAMNFTVLNNGFVRAQGTNFGKKFHRDFKVQCDAKSCKIDDVFDPASYKTDLQQFIKKPYC